MIQDGNISIETITIIQNNVNTMRESFSEFDHINEGL